MTAILLTLFLSGQASALANTPSVRCEQRYVVDRTNSKTLAQVIQDGGFAPLPQSQTFGFSPFTHWIHFECENPSDKKFEGEIQFTYPVVKTLNIYSDIGRSPTRLGFWDRAATPSEQAKVLPSFPLVVPPKARSSMYVEARSNGSLQLQTVLTTSEEARSQTLRPVFFYGFFFGSLLILAVYNFFLGMSLRDWTYFLYCGYVVSFFFYQVTITGYGVLFFGHIGYSLTEYRALFLHALFFFIALFAGRFLKLDSNSPRLAFVMRGVAVFYFAGALLTPILPTQVNLRFLALASTMVPVLLIATAIRARLAGFRPAKYFAVAWMLFLVAIVVTALRNVGLVPKVWIVDHVLEFGILAEITLISMGLGYNVRLLQDEKSEITADALREKIKVAELNANLEKEKTLSRLSAQVSHDIRSPLSALNMVLTSSSEIEEEKRVIVRNAVQRINDIANSLLNQSRRSPELQGEPDTDNNLMIVTVLDSIISEKRMQYRDNHHVEIVGDLDKGYGLFAAIDSIEFSRAISNLVNNSVDAISGKGRVTIAIRPSQETINILVADNGKGIPTDLIPLVGSRGFTWGKDRSSASGTGLGLYHAKAMCEKFGGELYIQSKEGVGTIITISLPRSRPPSWFVRKIDLAKADAVVTVDDDSTIHQIWSERLLPFQKSKTNGSHLSFSSTSEFMKWKANSEHLNALYLVDFEYLNESVSGLDLIEKAGIADRAILVTSHYEDTAVRGRAARLGVTILPKSLAPVIPIYF